MARFDDLLSIVLGNEGVGLAHNPSGLANIPGDPGGATNWGISQRAWEQLYHKLPYAGFPSSVRDLIKDQAKVVYQNEYYILVHGDMLPVGVALVLFDSAVNQGVGTAIRILQRALGVVDDGIWGSKTEGALRLACRDVPKLIEDVCWHRLLEYDHDTRERGEQSRFPWFLASLWIPRLVKVRNLALQMGA